MLSGATPSASETTGTAVFRIVVSSDSMKNATATSQGNNCLLAADGGCGGASVSMVVRAIITLTYFKVITALFTLRAIPLYSSAEPEIEPDRLMNDLGRETVSAVADCLHRLRYRAARATASLKRRDNAITTDSQ